MRNSAADLTEATSQKQLAQIRKRREFSPRSKISNLTFFLPFLTIVYVKRTLVLLIVKLDSLAGVLHWCNGENVMAKQWYLVHYTITLIRIVLFFSVITAQIPITTRATLYGGVHGQEFKAQFLLLSLYRGFRNLQPENFCLSNPESYALESGNPLMILESGNHVPLTKNPEPGAWNLESLTWNPKSRTVSHFFLHVKSWKIPWKGLFKNASYPAAEIW